MLATTLLLLVLALSALSKSASFLQRLLEHWRRIQRVRVRVPGGMTAAARKAQSERMKAYWGEAPEAT